MNASELTEWVTLFTNDLVPDGAGGDREAIPPNLQYDRPAKVEVLSGAEVQQGDQLSKRDRYRITIRWDVDITTWHRVYWRDRYFDIDSIINVDMGDTWLQLYCEQFEKGQQ